MTVHPLSGNVTHIQLNLEKYEVIRHIHSPLILVGRGTNVFIVRCKSGQTYVLKDSWILTSHGFSEIDMLRTINQYFDDDPDVSEETPQLFPQYIDSQEFADDTTQPRRGRLAPYLRMPPDRIRRRILSAGLGDPITTFRSKAEFVKILLDCVTCLEYMHTKTNIVHGDLSTNNIVICRIPVQEGNKPRTSPETTTQPTAAGTPGLDIDPDFLTFGLVIDFDYAREQTASSHFTSGTLPFMPLEALNPENAETFVHKPAHDLEALFYTAITVMTFTDGPCGKKRDALERIGVARWFNLADREVLFRDKEHEMLDFPKQFEKNLSKYWRPLIRCFVDLWKATWPDSTFPLKCGATHTRYKSILKATLEVLQTEHEPLAAYGSVDVTSLKRPRPSDADDSTYPAPKYIRCSEDLRQRLPRDAIIKSLSEWTD
ncbi:hypothetical protein CPB84DRAFT_1689030 [Gymnopilus junonius]|uniref:Protein kinase domain-containing protein n=1 Tax=Gymnopilus junonius TaxID=109634 RepID=A0A9P5N7K6_GYMJU|nr:hypothetical protein CPB84DRAFT_1693650 [Gymnopilus junonius]KAF8876686.1 hypothetical protein CPB84DRAFT_1689030 [Gymnopilus junonius]